MEKINVYLKEAVDSGADYLVIIAGKQMSIKKDGVISELHNEKLTPADTSSLIRELYNLADRDISEKLDRWDDNFSWSIPSLARFRINSFMQRGSLAMIIRIVRFTIPDYHEIGIPDNVIELSDLEQGLILITGPSSCGKSTTIATMIEHINTNKNKMIVTIEDPIEYLFRNKESIIYQREVSMDTSSYSTALRASVRQIPDVIMIGEMSGQDTIETAIMNAETGKLVISSMHTIGAVNTLIRLVQSMPMDTTQSSIQLAPVLKAIVYQQLVQTVEGKRIPVFELLRVNESVQELIRDCNTKEINNLLTKERDGMVCMDESLIRLYKQEQITRESLIRYALNKDYVRDKINS